MPDTVQDLIRAAAATHGIPAELALAVAEQESGFNPTLINPKKVKTPAGEEQAVGTFQFLPSTAAGIGIDPHDPRQNIDGGAKYLRQLMDKHQGNLDAVLREYGGVVHDDQYVPGVLARVGKFKSQVGGRGTGAGPLGGGAPGAPTGGVTGPPPPPPGPIGIPPAAATRGMLPSSTTTATSEIPYETPFEKERRLSKEVGGLLAAPFPDPRTPQGRTDLFAGLAAGAAGTALGGAGPVGGVLMPRAVQILGPILAGGVAGGLEVAAENQLGTAQPRNPVTEGAWQAAYEAGGQTVLWPLARFSRQLQAPGAARATIATLRGESRAAAATGEAGVRTATAEGNALVDEVKAKVASAVDAANAIKNAGVVQGPRAAARLAQQELDGSLQLAAVADRYNDLLGQQPSRIAAGEAAGAILTGPAKQALDAVGQQVAAAAKQGPPFQISRIREYVNDLVAHWRPAELYGGASGAATSGIPTAVTIGARGQHIAPGQRISIDEYKQLLVEQLRSKDLATLPGVLGKLQHVSGETIPFEVAHTIKELVGQVPKWEARAKAGSNAALAKRIYGQIREQMVGFEPYDTATAAYHALIPLHLRDVGKQMIRLAHEPAGAVKIASMLDSGDAAQATVLHNLLVTQAGAAGQLSQGQHAWNLVREVYTYDNLLSGGIDGLTKRMDELMTMRPEFIRAVYNDDVGANVWRNLAMISDGYRAGREMLEASGAAAIRGAKATAAAGKQAAEDVATAGKQAIEDKTIRFADSSMGKFTKRTTASVEADVLLVAATGGHSVWAMQAAVRLLRSPKAADLLEWAAYSNYNAGLFTRMLQGTLPAAAAANVLREAVGQISPPGQRGDRITPTGTAAR